MTNDGMLSQDEIDALLQVSGDEDTENQPEPGKQSLSTLEKDTLGEIGNISFGSSATTLSTLLHQKVEITTPRVSVIGQEELEKEITYEPVTIEVNFTEGFRGRNVFVIKADDAAVISDIMLGGDGTSPEKEMKDIHLSAVQEAMNQMMGSAATSMSAFFNKKIDISPPEIKYEDNFQLIAEQDAYVKVFFNLRVGDLIDSSMVQILPLTFSKEMVDELLQPNESTLVEDAQTDGPRHEQSRKQEDRSQQIPPETSQEHTPQYLGNSFNQQTAAVQQAHFSEFDKMPLNRAEQQNLDMLLDIPLKVTVELGRTKQTIQEILELASGSIIELDKLAGEPVDILVNDKLIAKGEVVVIDENFGVRVSDIISQTDRLMKLK